jgi:hypothetical protein
MAGDDEDQGDYGASPIRGPLTAEIAKVDSPVRGFLNDRFTNGLRDVQRRYRVAAPPLVVPAASPGDANAGTVGTAADWLLRFLLHPQPDMHLAELGVMQCAYANIDLEAALVDIIESVGASGSSMAAYPVSEERRLTFTGPLPGSTLDPVRLARCCWALALLSEAWRGGPAVAMRGPLGRFRDHSRVRGDDLLEVAPPAGLDQLAKLQRVSESVLIPQLASRRGPWTLGPTFSGSQLLSADADLIAAGLLLDLKTTAKKPSLGITDIFQVIGYTLLDFDDEYHIDTLGIFSARYAYLATWRLPALLYELAGHKINLWATRNEFRQMLSSHQAGAR